MPRFKVVALTGNWPRTGTRPAVALPRPSRPLRPRHGGALGGGACPTARTRPDTRRGGGSGTRGARRHPACATGGGVCRATHEDRTGVGPGGARAAEASAAACGAPPRVANDGGAPTPTVVTRVNEHACVRVGSSTVAVGLGCPAAVFEPASGTGARSATCPALGAGAVGAALVFFCPAAAAPVATGRPTPRATPPPLGGGSLGGPNVGRVARGGVSVAGGRSNTSTVNGFASSMPERMEKEKTVVL